MNKVTVTGIGIDNKIKKDIQDEIMDYLASKLTQKQSATVTVTIKESK